MIKTIPVQWDDPKEIQIDIVGARRIVCEMITESNREYRELERAGYITNGKLSEPGRFISESQRGKHGVKTAQAIDVLWFFDKGIEIAIEFTGLDLSADVVRKKLREK